MPDQTYRVVDDRCFDSNGHRWEMRAFTEAPAQWCCWACGAKVVASEVVAVHPIKAPRNADFQRETDDNGK